MKVIIIFILILNITLSCKHKEQIKQKELSEKILPNNIDSLKKLLQTTTIDTIQIQILNKMAEIEENDSLKISFNEQLEKLLNLFLLKKHTINEKNFYKKFYSKVLYRKGCYLSNKGEFTDALKYYEKCIKISKEINNDHFILNCYNNIGNDYFYKGDYLNTIEYVNKSIKIYKKINDKKGIGYSLHKLGIIYYCIGDFSKALDYFNKSIKINKEINYKQGIANSLNNIGIIYEYMGDYNKAIDYYQRSLKIELQIGNKEGIALSYNNIGIIFHNQGNYSKAIEYYQKSLKIQEEIDDKNGMAGSLNNLGLIYFDQEEYEKSLENYLKSLKIFRELNDKKNIATLLNNIGHIYINKNNYDLALENYIKSLKIREEINDKQGIIASLKHIGSVYLSRNNLDSSIKYLEKSKLISEEIGEKFEYPKSLALLSKIYIRKGNIKKSLQYAELSYKIATETGNIENIRNASSSLDTIYYLIGNYKLSRYYFERYIQMRDSIKNEQNRKIALQKYYQYKYEKKAAADSVAHAKEMKIKDITIAKQKSEARKNKIIAGISIAGIIVVFAFLVFVYRSLQITRRQKLIIEEQKRIVDAKNIELAHQNDEITRQRDEITKQRDEIQNQRDLIQKQKDEIEYIHNELKSSINYAQRIQEAVLPSREAGKSIKRPHFIMFKPKDVVSGDFYWYAEIGDTEVYAVADCTGHGVPGGFMSMLGIALLNEIVRKKEITQANQVLNELRKEIIMALKQRGAEGEQKDGMDMSLLIIENNKRICQWSGANNSLYIISDNLQIENLKSQIENTKVVYSSNGFSLLELEPDPMPVSIHPTITDFTNDVFPIPQNAYFYLFSDGFADQFGGAKNKKYGYKRLREMLLSIVDKNIEEQGKIIEQEFEQWKGNNVQTDDVTMLIVKV